MSDKFQIITFLGKERKIMQKAVLSSYEMKMLKIYYRDVQSQKWRREYYPKSGKI
jgi:hypothetical protein